MASNTDPRTGETLVTVSGIVRDANTGDTLPGAHVYYLDADGMAHGEATSAAGAFGLVVPVGSTLRASFVGYTPQERAVNASGSITFDLQPGVDIPEVEIVGDAPGAPAAAVAFGLLATLLALATSDRSDGRL